MNNNIKLNNVTAFIEARNEMHGANQRDIDGIMADTINWSTHKLAEALRSEDPIMLAAARMELQLRQFLGGVQVGV